MELKKILLLVDNRQVSSPDPCDQKPNPSIDFRGSAFKATQIDAGEEIPDSSWQECMVLSQLQKRVQILEEKVQKLEQIPSNILLKKKKRRKAKQIERQFKCPNSSCGKLYGSETSLRNHVKLKHGGKN